MNKKSKANIFYFSMVITAERKSFKKRFSFDSKGLEEAHRFVIQTIIDYRTLEEMDIQCFFYTGKDRFPCSVIEFERSRPKTRGIYGTKGQNEMTLMKKMRSWRGEGLPIKSDVIGTLIGRNLPITDFHRFRQMVEASGVAVEKSSLLSGFID